MAVNMAMSGVSIIFGTILRFYLVSLNKKLDHGEMIDDVDGTSSSSESEERKREREEQGLPGVAAERGFRFLV
jgi:hypothetical protein